MSFLYCRGYDESSPESSDIGTPRPLYDEDMIRVSDWNSRNMSDCSTRRHYIRHFRTHSNRTFVIRSNRESLDDESEGEQPLVTRALLREANSHNPARLKGWLDEINHRFSNLPKTPSPEPLKRPKRIPVRDELERERPILRKPIFLDYSHLVRRRNY
eukprot:GHVL01005067.1.p1 GENE.GHVL01005067.1~~GHVL01005067.1.p1  ORF type:complete len:158 (-),score=23.86 GHVL01005067.1:30-503(-)